MILKTFSDNYNLFTISEILLAFLWIFPNSGINSFAFNINYFFKELGMIVFIGLKI